MKIYFVRHGYADVDLIEEGVLQLQEAADFLKQQNLNLGVVRLLTSELKRAISSAKIIQMKLECSEPESVRWLTNESRMNIPACIDEFSQNNLDCQVIVAVSHMPEIELSLARYARSFGQKFQPDADNGSIHLVDTETKEVNKLFKPSL